MRIDRLVPLAVVASRIAALTSACAKRNGGAYCVETLAAGEPIFHPHRHHLRAGRQAVRRISSGCPFSRLA